MKQYLFANSERNSFYLIFSSKVLKEVLLLFFFFSFLVWYDMIWYRIYFSLRLYCILAGATLRALILSTFYKINMYHCWMNEWSEIKLKKGSKSNKKCAKGTKNVPISQNEAHKGPIRAEFFYLSRHIMVLNCLVWPCVASYGLVAFHGHRHVCLVWYCMAFLWSFMVEYRNFSRS